VKPPRIVAVGLAFLVGATGLLVATPSLASWTDVEHVRSDAATADCTQPGSVDATAWGRMLTGTLLGTDLDPVAAIDGITVDNLDPALTSTATTAAVETDLGSDAWSADLALSVLSALDVGAGIPLPFDTDVGSYTQYGRATSDGISVGASGAVTSAAGGLASLDDPGTATPRLATLRLSTLIDSALPGVGVDTADLADAELRIGTVGAIAELDSCATLWSGAAPGSDLLRDYLIQDLGLALTSATVTDVASEIRSSVTGLETTLDALSPAGTAITGAALTAVQSTLATILDLDLLGVDISLASLDSATIGVDFDLDPVIAAVSGELTDGVVTIDLTSGLVHADLAALFDEAYGSSGGLNGLPANTSVLTAPVLAELSARAGALLADFIDVTLQPLLDAALEAATVTVVLDATLRTQATVLFTTVNVLGLDLHTEITGTVGGFTGVSGAPTPTVATTVTESSAGILNTLLVLLGINLNSLTTAVVAAVAAPLVTNLVPVIGSQVVTPLLATATATTASTISSLTGVTVPAFLVALDPVLDALRTLVEVTVNAQPDQAGSVGEPDDPGPGRWYQSAIHVGVVDDSAVSVAEFYLANASVGPNSLR
jgi:predicted ribosomally synthesized peptide with SipW-like signal peptide